MRPFRLPGLFMRCTISLGPLGSLSSPQAINLLGSSLLAISLDERLEYTLCKYSNLSRKILVLIPLFRIYLIGSEPSYSHLLLSVWVLLEVTGPIPALF